jgi:hypothetical protein
MTLFSNAVIVLTSFHPVIRLTLLGTSRPPSPAAMDGKYG